MQKKAVDSVNRLKLHLTGERGTSKRTSKQAVGRLNAITKMGKMHRQVFFFRLLVGSTVETKTHQMEARVEKTTSTERAVVVVALFRFFGEHVIFTSESRVHTSFG